MKIHELKTDPIQFDAVEAGLKTFEIRKDDRGFQAGDILILRRTDYSAEEMKSGYPLLYGRHMRKGVKHVLRGPIYGLAEDWVIMSLV